MLAASQPIDHGTRDGSQYERAEGLPPTVLEETCRLQRMCEKGALALAPRNNLPQYEMEREWKGRGKAKTTVHLDTLPT